MIHCQGIKLNVSSLILVGALTSKPYAFAVRPWELHFVDTLDFMDSGCSSIRLDIFSNKILRILPSLIVKGFGWISDRIRFSYDGLTRLRLGYPLFLVRTHFLRINWGLALEVLGWVLSRSLVNKLGCSFILYGVLGKFLDCQSIVVFKELFYRLGSFIFFSGRVRCFSDFKSNFLLSYGTEYLKLVRLLFIIGFNPRFELPVLSLRIRKCTLANKQFFIGILGNSSSLNYYYRQVGLSLSSLVKIVEGRHWFSAMLRINLNKVFIYFSSLLLRRPNGFVFNKLSRYCSKLIGLQNKISFLYFDVGQLNSFLMSIKVPLSRWFLEEITIGSMHVGRRLIILYLLGSDFLINSDLGGDFLIYQGHHSCDKVLNQVSPDLVLPSLLFFELDSVVVNFEGFSLFGKCGLQACFGARADRLVFASLCYIVALLRDFTFQSSYLSRVFEHDPSIFFLNTKFCYLFFYNSVFLKVRTSFGYLGSDNFLFLVKVTNFFKSNSLLWASRLMGICERSLLNKYLNF